MWAEIKRVLDSRLGRIAVNLVIGVAVFALLITLGGKKNFGPSQYLQLILDGLRGGAIYALIALGFVTVFNVTGVINFAQGGFVMLGAMLCVTFNDLDAFASLPPALRLALSALLSGGNPASARP